MLPKFFEGGDQGHIGFTDGAVAEVGHRRDVVLLGVRCYS